MDAALKIDEYFTYTDYCSWDDNERWELIDGVPCAMSPAPTERHQDAVGVIYTQLFFFLRGKPCKVFIAPFDVRLNANESDDTVVQPDILVVCDKTKLDGKSVVGAPDFVVEVLSPSSHHHDLITKLKLYMKSGVREYWIVDPDSKTVSTHVFNRTRTGSVSSIYDESEDAAPVAVLEGCTINLTEVFGEM